MAKPKRKCPTTARELVDLAEKATNRKSRSEATEKENVLEGLRLLIRAADLLIEQVNAGGARTGRSVASALRRRK